MKIDARGNDVVFVMNFLELQRWMSGIRQHTMRELLVPYPAREGEDLQRSPEFARSLADHSTSFIGRVLPDRCSAMASSAMAASLSWLLQRPHPSLFVFKFRKESSWPPRSGAREGALKQRQRLSLGVLSFSRSLRRDKHTIRRVEA